jgi:hypothetical protein
MEKIRLATEEEVKEIADVSNLTPMSRVLALGPMRGVWKVCNELDPVILNGASNTQLCMFVWGIENIFKGAGLTEYYFNVAADNEEYIKVIEHFGGERQSKQPDYRYKVNL